MILLMFQICIKITSPLTLKMGWTYLTTRSTLFNMHLQNSANAALQSKPNRYGEKFCTIKTVNDWAFLVLGIGLVEFVMCKE